MRDRSFLDERTQVNTWKDKIIKRKHIPLLSFKISTIRVSDLVYANVTQLRFVLPHVSLSS